MAKVFDLVHKVADHHEASRIPFEDEEQKSDETAKKQKIKVEVVFFYLLLFAVFFIMGAVFLAPNFFTATNGKTTKNALLPSSTNTPLTGFTIDKEGKPDEEIAKIATGQTATQTNNAAPIPIPTPITARATATIMKTASIQVLNGTNITGAAAALQSKLAEKGIVVQNIGNYKKRTVTKTTIYFKPDFRQAATDVLAVAGGIMVEALSATTTGEYDVVVIIGQKN